MSVPEGFTPKSVKRPRMQVEEQLRDAIASGQLRQGEKLPSEAALAELFGVSRATVREALRSLVSAGLIRTQPGAVGGSFVQKVGPDELSEMIATSMRSTLALGTIEHDEVATVRGMLEIPSARLAAENRTDDDLAAIQEVLDREREVAFDDPARAELEVKFHSLIARASHNNALTAVLGALRIVAQPALDQTAVGTARAVVRHHADIFEAIESGDPDAAEEAARKHLDHLAQAGRRSSVSKETGRKGTRPKSGGTRRTRATRAS